MTKELNLVREVIVSLGVVIDNVHQQFGARPRQTNNKDRFGERRFHLSGAIQNYLTLLKRGRTALDRQKAHQKR